MSDSHWLVKDFHVLYRTARQLVAPDSKARGDASAHFTELEMQLRRLRPAFETCEAERHTQAMPFVMRGSLRQQFVDLQNRLNRLADEGAVGLLSKTDVALLSYALGMATATTLRQRLTEAERKALNALHRWLHSPAGDDALIEDAQDYHEQVEAEDAHDCERLQDEERIAWANLVRGEAGT